MPPPETKNISVIFFSTKNLMTKSESLTGIVFVSIQEILNYFFNVLDFLFINPWINSEPKSLIHDNISIDDISGSFIFNILIGRVP